jgi:hypothetical protein
MTGAHGGRILIDIEVRRDAMVFDLPLSIGRIPERQVGCGDGPTVDQRRKAENLD